MARLATDTKKSKLALQRFAGAALIMLTLVLVINSFQAQARSSGPKVMVSEYRHDFGDVFPGQFMDHVFTIHNEGTAPLTLSDVVRHAPDASVYRPAVHRSAANALAQSPSQLFLVDGTSMATSSFLAANAAEARSSGPPPPVPT